MADKVGKAIANKLGKPIEKSFKTISKKAFRPLVKSFKTGFDKITKALQQILDFLSSLSNTLNAIFKTIKNLFKSLFNALKPIIKFVKTLGIKFASSITKVFKNITDIFKAIMKNLMKVLNLIFKFLRTIYITINKFFTNLFNMIAGFVMTIVHYIFCTIKKLGAFDKCFPYYFVDIFLFFVLLPYRFMVWLFDLGELEKMFMDFIDVADSIMYKATTGVDENGNITRPGFHIPGYKWSAEIMDKCYRCNSKPDETPDDLEETFLKFFKSDKEESFFSFCLKNGITIAIIIIPLIYFYNLFTSYCNE